MFGCLLSLFSVVKTNGEMGAAGCTWLQGTSAVAVILRGGKGNVRGPWQCTRELCAFPGKCGKLVVLYCRALYTGDP